MEINIKKAIDNKHLCHRFEVYIEDDDYGIIERYKDWANISTEQAFQSVINYSMRIIKNILKYHKNYSNLDSLVEHIANEAKIDLSIIKEKSTYYTNLMKETKILCEKRCEYTPYERSYWFDILLLLIKVDQQIKSNALLKN